MLPGSIPRAAHIVQQGVAVSARVKEQAVSFIFDQSRKAPLCLQSLIEGFVVIKDSDGQSLSVYFFWIAFHVSTFRSLLDPFPERRACWGCSSIVSHPCLLISEGGFEDRFPGRVLPGAQFFMHLLIFFRDRMGADHHF